MGSPDVFLEGNAGPYSLYITVRVPQVIPGIAEIEIRSHSNNVSEIQITPMQLTGPGSQFAPVADVMKRSATDPQFFTGTLWLMEFGSLQVRVGADGSLGKGEIAVPVPAVAQRTLPMARPLGILLFSLMILLAFAMVSIVAAAVREGDLQPGEAAPFQNLRRARKGAVLAAVVVAGLLFVGREWWQSDARRYARNIYTPPELQATIDSAGRLVLHAEARHVASGNPRRPSDKIDFEDLILDHNHMMHLFLIRTPRMDSFWHLHPIPDGAGNFAENIPTVPPGHYQIFADIVLSSGFPVTMVGSVDIPAFAGKPMTGDDSSVLAQPISDATAETMSSPLPDGGRMIWERDSSPLKSNVPLNFQFRVEGADGKPATDLDPYMGMSTHAEIIRSDGSVFAHVHPSGSVSMAALDIAQAGIGGSAPSDSGMSPMQMQSMGSMAGMAMHGEHVDSEISFPYGFPKPGRYRVFVQVKRAGRVETGVFDTNVQ